MKPPRFQIKNFGGLGTNRHVAPTHNLGGRQSGGLSYNPQYKSRCVHTESSAAGLCCQRAKNQQQQLQRVPFLPEKSRLPCQFITQKRSISTTSKMANQTQSDTANTVISKEPVIHDLFESKTGTWQYVVADPSTKSAVIIDPVLDFDPATQAITTQSADALLSVVKKNNYKVVRILETHAHADHLTAASYLQRRLSETQGDRPSIGIGKRIGKVQSLFGRKYGVMAEEYEGVFDQLFDDDEKFDIGQLQAMAIHLPGHTPDHLGYKIGDNVFCGDSLFHPDIGTARCDFPGGSAKDLFESGRKLLSLPDHTKIWTGHDYPPASRKVPVAWMSVGEHKEQNRHLKDGVTEEEFVALREERDSGLGAPRLLHQSLQVNVRAGHLPKPNEAGHRLLHVPLKLEKGAEW